MDIAAIKLAIEEYKKSNPLDDLEPLRETLKEGHRKGMSLKQLCEVVKKNSSLKPSAGSLRSWLKLPKQSRQAKKTTSEP